MFDPDETPAQRSLRARMAVHRSWAKTSDRTKRTAPARRGLDARFEREVDPDGTLPPDERAVRAASARKAYYAELALKSSKACTARSRARSEGAKGRSR